MRQLWTSRLRLGTMTRGGTILSVALLAGTGAVAAGNDAPAPGARVRVTTPDGRVVGRLVELNGDTLVLSREKRGGPETLRVDRRQVMGLEVSQWPSRKGKGVRIGILAGLGAAIAVGAFGGESCTADPGPADWMNFSRKLDSSTCIDHGEAALLSGILTVPLGALVGAAVMPGEKWSPAPVGGLSVRPVAVRRGGVGVQVALGRGLAARRRAGQAPDDRQDRIRGSRAPPARRARGDRLQARRPEWAWLEVRYDGGGQVEHLGMPPMEDLSRECRRAARVLLMSALVPGDRPPRPGGTDVLLLTMVAPFLSCLAEDPPPTLPARRPGGPITEPRKTRGMNPVYPPDAARDRRQGVVILEAVISPSGCVRSAEVLRGAAPDLDGAALRAVTQWAYTPAPGRPGGPRHHDDTVDFKLH